tara:strand:+ start:251 stop:481 length:231 start_codon:yes stop_codon:yes gene_type:complete
MDTIKGYCKYCDKPNGFINKKGRSKHWGMACTGCRGTLTRWFNSKKHTLEELLSAKYNNKTHKWDIPSVRSKCKII